MKLSSLPIPSIDFRMKYISLAIALLCSINVFAQPEATMYTLSGVPQHVNYNPAFVPNYKFVLSLGTGSVHGHYSNSSFSYSDLAVRRGDSLVADLVKFNSSLNKKNYITMAGDVEVFRLGIQLSKRLYFNWTVGTKVFARQMIPQDLTSLFINGTAGFVNSSASFSPALEATSYLESAFGASYKVNDKLTVGGRLKLLRGIVNASTESSELRLSVADDYTMTLTGDVFARTSGIQNADDADVNDYLKNKGFAIDLGATLKLTEKLSVGASLLDVGAINWKNDTYAYTLDPSVATYTFAGVDLLMVMKITLMVNWIRWNLNLNYKKVQRVATGHHCLEKCISMRVIKLKSRSLLVLYSLWKNSKAGFIPDFPLPFIKNFGA